MEDNKALASENARLLGALRKIKEHNDEIKKILNEVSDLLATKEQTESAPVTDEDVKELLKKYSRLH
jgi:negative regulator of sigma E activity